MTKPKKPKQLSKNPIAIEIETAIGNRAKTTKDIPPIVDGKEYQKLMEPGPMQHPILDETPDEPSPSEMQTLEELDRQTMERLEDKYPEEKIDQTITQTERQIPVSKHDPPPATKTSTPASPVETINKGVSEIIEKSVIEEIPDVGRVMELPTQTSEERQTQKEIFTELGKLIPPAEDIELTNLKKYILEDGFVVNTVAFHIVSLCAEPLMTPSTTMWDFKDRANIPDMVFALLNQPGYLEGIWPSLKIVMGSNVGNSAWSAGISTTIAFFDVVRTLPALKELQNETI